MTNDLFNVKDNGMVSVGSVSFKIEGGVSEYHYYGYVNTDHEGLVCFQPADRRRKPVAIVPMENLAYVRVEL